jgi:hypothetical protein
MKVDNKIVESVQEIVKKKEQTEFYRKELLALIENFISNNSTDDDILGVIESTKSNKKAEE